MERYGTHTEAHPGARRCLSHYAPKTMGHAHGRHEESGHDSPNSDDSQKKKRKWTRGEGNEGKGSSPNKDRFSLNQTGGYETTDCWTNDPKNQDSDQQSIGTKNRRTVAERNQKMSEDFLNHGRGGG